MSGPPARNSVKHNATAVFYTLMARRAARYQIQHASGRITVTSAALFIQHVQSGELIRTDNRRAFVAPHLTCWAENGSLKFSERHDKGFSGDTPIRSQWAAILRAWLHRGPFVPMCDLDYIIRTRTCTRAEAYEALQDG